MLLRPLAHPSLAGSDLWLAARQVSGLTGTFRHELITNPAITLAATIGHLMAAIRKLSAVATHAEASSPLWRGVRGALPRGFWQPDETGCVCAVDMAFMSTSRERETPIGYMCGDRDAQNVLWKLSFRIF